MPLWDPNLTWLPITPLMLVKEPSDLALKLSCVLQLAHRNGVFKKFALDSRRQIVPLHDDCGAQTPQNMLLFLGEGSHVVSSFLRCALCSAALVVPSCEGIGLVRAFACAVRHRLALSSCTNLRVELSSVDGMPQCQIRLGRSQSAGTPPGTIWRDQRERVR